MISKLHGVVSELYWVVCERRLPYARYRVCARSVRVLPSRPGHATMIPGDLLRPRACVKPHLYPASLHVVLSSILHKPVTVFYEVAGAHSIRDPVSGLPRTPLLGTSVNKKSRCC